MLTKAIELWRSRRIPTISEPHITRFALCRWPEIRMEEQEPEPLVPVDGSKNKILDDSRLYTVYSQKRKEVLVVSPWVSRRKRSAHMSFS